METVLSAKQRTDFRKSTLNQLRKRGMIPAVIYGKKVGNIPVSIPKSDFLKVVRQAGRSGLIQMDVEGTKQNVIIQEYQEHPMSKEIIHIDFWAVDLSSEIKTDVPVVLVGEAKGVKEGGILQQALYEMNITTKASEIPPSIEIDVSDLDIDDTIIVGEIIDRYPFKINHDPEEVIATVLPPEQEDVVSDEEQSSDGEQEDSDTKDEE
jgi:large subunit ribosomal protein L25